MGQIDDVTTDEVSPRLTVAGLWARARYQLRFAAEALWATWRRSRLTRRPGARRPRAARARTRVAAASALLLGVLLGPATPISRAAGPASGVGVARPAFAAPVINPFNLVDVGSRSAPTFADLDADGDLDAFVGESNGTTVYFENTGTAVSPAFAASSANPFDLGSVGWRSTPIFVDLDADGDLDALVGDYTGDTRYRENTGTAVSPAFAASSTNPFGLANVGSESAPALADLDADGDLDALIGSGSGHSVYFRNSGVSIGPVFASPSLDPFSLHDVGWNARPTFADLDGDGDLDAFIGQDGGHTIYFANTGTAPSPAFAASSANPFGLTDVGDYASPTFADLDADGDLDAFIGAAHGNTIYFENTGTPGAPHFFYRTSNPFGLTDVGWYSVPAFAKGDWDGDLDLFVGNDDGHIVFFQNSGTVLGPAFAAPSIDPFLLQDVGTANAPAFADLDGDGDLDVFVGEFTGAVVYFENTATAASPAFAPSSANPFGLVAVGTYASPTFADLDADGDLDAFIGNHLGQTIYFANTGTAVSPAFAAHVTNPFGLTSAGWYSCPRFADLDGDGDLDAFVGADDGNTMYFENTGTAVVPAFAAGSGNPFGLRDVGSYATPAFADLDGDGDLDAFVGNSMGNIAYFENAPLETWLPLALRGG